MTTAWLSDAELASWARMATVMQLLSASLESQLRRDSQMTHFEYRVLMMLSNDDERRLTMTTLAGQSVSTPPRLSHVVERLEKRGFVERGRDEKDARVVYCRLTDAGFQALREAAPGHAEHVRRIVVDPLTRRQLEQAGRICDVLLQQLDEDGSTRPSYERYDHVDD